MTTAVIVDAVRTPGGKRNGKLRGWHAVDLAAEPLKALVQRNDLDPALVDDVIVGCVMQVGEQALNIGRNAVLAAGFPESVPATTLDRQCGSSQQALHFAAQGVIAGAYDVVIAAGIEHMTHTPMGSSVVRDLGFPFGPQVMGRYAERGGLVGQGISAEMIADQWNLSREDLDEFGVRSQKLAATATAEGRFEREIVPVAVKDDEGNVTKEMLSSDEGVRPDTTVETLANLKAAFKPDGKVTAGNSSQITDGASAVLIMSEEKAAALGLTPRARFHAFALAGVDPVTMLTGPIPATKAVLERAKMTLDDIDLVEINEAFASVVLAWEKELHPDMAKVNVNGGAIALGHPLGASGAKLMATLLNELERTGGRWGLETMCEGRHGQRHHHRAPRLSRDALAVSVPSKKPRAPVRGFFASVSPGLRRRARSGGCSRAAPSPADPPHGSGAARWCCPTDR
ncbi:MAG TPA: thiolase family protein [Acidimicrobiales bacterium]|nr:thiolase family protein [Acidimicrobiales bacterium]